MTTTLPVLAAPGPEHVASPAAATELDDIIVARAVHSLFQPIVDLSTREPVAFEALSRGPAGSPLQGPDPLFAAARAAGRVDELDRLCRVRALEAVVDSDLQAPFALFVNREPSALGADGSSAAQLVVLRRRGIRVVIELTERDLSRDPAQLLAFAKGIRAAGMGIALDDVGVDADSLALMPFLMPDVVKLDMGLLHRRPDAATARIVSAVRTHAERHGTVILAEGIETPEHERMAVALGATLGQGWLYGRPGSLPTADDRVPLSTPSRPLELREPEDELAAASPFETVTRQNVPLRASVDLLFALRQELELGVEQMHGYAVVLLSCVDAPHISCACAEHYTNLASCARFAAALGAGMPEQVVPGLRGSRLDPTDPVSSEWDLVVVGPHFAAAVIARERFDAHPEEGRVFDYVLTYDRALVVDVARSLMTRALPLVEPDPQVDAVLAADGGATREPTLDPVLDDVTARAFAPLAPDVLHGARTVAARLQEALHRRVVLDQATGVLARQADDSTEDAATILHTDAHRRGVRPVDLARDVVAGTADPVPADLVPAGPPASGPVSPRAGCTVRR